VLLVGGISCVPMVSRMLVTNAGFNIPGQIDQSMEPQTAVACGAAVYAAQLCPKSKDRIPKLALVDVAPLDIGVDLFGDRFSSVIHRGNQIPGTYSSRFVTCYNDQKTLPFSIYEGCRKIASLNKYLGSFRVTGLPDGAASDVGVKLKMELDDDGILNVEAEHDNGRLERMEIDYGGKKTVGLGLEKMLRQAEVNRVGDTKHFEKESALGDFHTKIQKKKYKCQNGRILAVCEEYERWMELNKQTADVAQIQTKLAQFIIATFMESSSY